MKIRKRKPKLPYGVMNAILEFKARLQKEKKFSDSQAGETSQNVRRIRMRLALSEESGLPETRTSHTGRQVSPPHYTRKDCNCKEGYSFNETRHRC